MIKFNHQTGYPEGRIPTGWQCPLCSKRWHDSEAQGEPDVAWGYPAYCNVCNVDMEKEEVNA